MNGIHEVTGSIPVWSTILRSVMQAKVAHYSAAKRRGGGPFVVRARATVGKPTKVVPNLAHHLRSVMQAKVGDAREVGVPLQSQGQEAAYARSIQARRFFVP